MLCLDDDGSLLVEGMLAPITPNRDHSPRRVGADNNVEQRAHTYMDDMNSSWSNVPEHVTVASHSNSRELSVSQMTF